MEHNIQQSLMRRISIYQVCRGFGRQRGMSAVEVFSLTSMEWKPVDSITVSKMLAA